MRVLMRYDTVQHIAIVCIVLILPLLSLWFDFDINQEEREYKKLCRSSSGNGNVHKSKFHLEHLIAHYKLRHCM